MICNELLNFIGSDYKTITGRVHKINTQFWPVYRLEPCGEIEGFSVDLTLTHVINKHNNVRFERLRKNTN